MVKLGFIAEGASEKIILEHSDFFPYLDRIPVSCIREVIDAKGNGNLLPHNLERHTKILEEKGATVIFILTDLDNDECITHTKSRISPQAGHIVSVSVKAIEAWFLAGTEAMRAYLKDPSFIYDDPEKVINPFEEIKSLRLSKLGIGISDKKILANTLVHKMKFSIARAAQHPGCNSAKYFLKMISKAVSN
jgi:hypothetical protein